MPQEIEMVQADSNELTEFIERSSSPWIVKPGDSSQTSKRGFHIAHSPEQLSQHLKTITDGQTKWLVQEYVTHSKDAKLMEVLGLSNGQEIRTVCVCGLKKRIYPEHFGSSANLVTVHDRNLIEITTRFIDKIQFRGVFDIEVLKTPHGFVFIEINFRCGMPIDLAACSGLNLVQMAVSNRVPATSNYREGCVYIREPYEWRAVREKRLSLVRFIASFFTANSRTLFSFRDPWPVLVKYWPFNR